MDSMLAFAIGRASAHKEPMVFDWDKAAQIIKERKVTKAGAGLAGDWEWTGGTIFKNGAPVPESDTYVFLSSTWATPELEVGGEIIECYRMKSESPGWHEHTYWPQSALDILNAEK